MSGYFCFKPEVIFTATLLKVTSLYRASLSKCYSCSFFYPGNTDINWMTYTCQSELKIQNVDFY